MAQIAVFDRPGNFAVMAGPAELAIDDLDHVDFIAAGLELEAQVGMADLAAETNPMEPVRENSRAHTGFIGIVVDDDIPIFGIGRRDIDEQQHPGYQSRHQRHERCPSFSFPHLPILVALVEIWLPPDTYFKIRNTWLPEYLPGKITGAE
ncbi:MAG TPA: hypothetical protein VGK14_08110 [Novimethylophilus sp.]